MLVHKPSNTYLIFFEDPVDTATRKGNIVIDNTINRHTINHYSMWTDDGLVPRISCSLAQ